MELNHRLRITEDVIYQKVDEEMVLLNLETGIYYGLDPVGSRFLELLLQHDSLDRVFENMLREYEVSPERLQQDIQRLVQQLQTNKLVDVVT